MSNAIYIDVNKVENVVSKAISYVIEVWDDYNQGSTSIIEEEVPQTDIDALICCITYSADGSSDISDVINAIEEYQEKVTINGTEYSWDEIKNLFDNEENENG